MSRAWSVLRRRPLALIGLAVVIVHVALALLAPAIVPFDPLKLVDAPLEPPGGPYALGTDELGRDFLSRLLMGGRVSIVVAFAAGAIAAGAWLAGWVARSSRSTRAAKALSSSGFWPSSHSCWV
jgi:peptide/nickel transport system permease protein